MSKKNQMKTNSIVGTSADRQATSSNGVEAQQEIQPSGNRVMATVMAHVAQRNYDAAIKLLGKPAGDEIASNTLGVCLLRVGNAKDAVELFRRLALMPGSTLLREHVQPEYVRNYAVALVMCGLPGAVKILLGELPEQKHPMAVQIRSAIKQWTKSLPLFRRLDWMLCGIAPSDCEIPLSFEPGEFYFRTETRTSASDADRKSSSKLAI